MHRKLESDLFPVDYELERTMWSLRKVSRVEKETMADERISQTIEQEKTTKKASNARYNGGFLEARHLIRILNSQTTCCRGVCLFLYRLKTPQIHIVKRVLHFSCIHVTFVELA